MMQIVFLTLVIAYYKPIFVASIITTPEYITTTYSPTKTISESMPFYKGLHLTFNHFKMLFSFEYYI